MSSTTGLRKVGTLEKNGDNEILENYLKKKKFAK